MTVLHQITLWKCLLLLLQWWLSFSIHTKEPDKKIVLNSGTITTNDAEMQKWWETHLFPKILKDVAVGCDPPCTVFDCAALESPNSVFKFPSLELSSALTCALETSGLPVARGAGGPRARQLLLIRCLLTVPTASTLQRMRFNPPPPCLCPLQCAQRQPQKVRPCSTTTESC